MKDFTREELAEMRAMVGGAEPVTMRNADLLRLLSMAERAVSQETLRKRYGSAYRARWYEKRPMTDDEAAAVLTMASCYLHLTTYELGQEHCVAQLRDIWRARRAREEAARLADGKG